jgi:hypothetical protein
MRIALVSAPARRDSNPACAQALLKGMEAMGHRVDFFNAWTEDGNRLPGYEYIVVVAESASFFGGKMPEPLAKMLGGSSSLVGKKAAAFLRKTGPFNGRALANIMRAMEKEGMCVNWFDVLLNPAQSEAVGKRIGA